MPKKSKWQVSFWKTVQHVGGNAIDIYRLTDPGPDQISLGVPHGDPGLVHWIESALIEKEERDEHRVGTSN